MRSALSSTHAVFAGSLDTEELRMGMRTWEYISVCRSFALYDENRFYSGPGVALRALMERGMQRDADAMRMRCVVLRVYFGCVEIDYFAHNRFIHLPHSPARK